MNSRSFIIANSASHVKFIFVVIQVCRDLLTDLVKSLDVELPVCAELFSAVFKKISENRSSLVDFLRSSELSSHIFGTSFLAVLLPKIV